MQRGRAEGGGRGRGGRRREEGEKDRALTMTLMCTQTLTWAPLSWESETGIQVREEEGGGRISKFKLTFFMYLRT
jgi:hypothetical protein